VIARDCLEADDSGSELPTAIFQLNPMSCLGFQSLVTELKKKPELNWTDISYDWTIGYGPSYF
jgi:hypothetical protein